MVRVGFAWSGRRRWCRRRSSAASYRVIANDRKFCSTDSGGALPSLAQRCGAADRKDQRNLAALIMLSALTRAHNRETRRLLTNRPGSSFSTKSPIPTNVYASAIGLCKDFMIMQSRKPSNSDLYGAFDVNLFSIPLLLSHLTEVQSWTFRGEFAVRHGSSRRILVFGGSMRPEP